MTDTWPTEFRTWGHTAAFTPVLIREEGDEPSIKAAQVLDRKEGRVRKAEREFDPDCEWPLHESRARAAIREELARSPADIHFINREQVEWLVNLHGPRWPYRTVIIDESSSFKDYKTERYKALKKVRQTPGLITRLHELTATPAAETYEHLFAQLYLLDLGKRLGKNITHYRNDHFVSNQYTRKWTLRPGHEQLVLDKIKDICLVMQAKDYLKVEEATVVKRPVRLPESVMALYEQMQKEMLVTLPDGTVVEAETAAALASKLLQMASGVLYETHDLLDADTEELSKVKRVHKLHDAKIETLKEIVEGLQGSPVLVAYHFKSSLDRLKKAFPKATVMDRDGKCVKDWNAGKIPILLIHPASGGHGLNLQKGPGHNIVFFDLVYSLELWTQLIGRLARQGQKNPVLVQVLIAIGTRDEDVFEMVNGKQDAQDQFFKLLKKLIRKYRQAKEKPHQCEVCHDL